MDPWNVCMYVPYGAPNLVACKKKSSYTAPRPTLNG
jgi:hypothetical protein